MTIELTQLQFIKLQFNTLIDKVHLMDDDKAVKATLTANEIQNIHALVHSCHMIATFLIEVYDEEVENSLSDFLRIGEIWTNTLLMLTAVSEQMQKYREKHDTIPKTVHEVLAPLVATSEIFTANKEIFALLNTLATCANALKEE